MLATAPLMLALRFLHIVSGALWVGSSFMFTGFIGPSAAEVGPSAAPLLRVAVKKRKVHKVITGLATVTVVAGWWMWLRDMSERGSLGDWVGSRFGLVLTIGATLATIAFFAGALGVGRNVERLVNLSDEVGEGPPSPEQQTRMARVMAELEKYGKLDLLLLVLAVTAMSTARYW